MLMPQTINYFVNDDIAMSKRKKSFRLKVKVVKEQTESVKFGAILLLGYYKLYIFRIDK